MSLLRNNNRNWSREKFVKTRERSQIIFAIEKREVVVEKEMMYIKMGGLTDFALKK